MEPETSHLQNHSGRRRLTLHIGLPKTGTTSVQSNVFPRLPGYLGKFYPSPAMVSGEAYRELLKIRFGAYPECSRERRRQHIRQWESKYVCGAVPRTLLSAEELTWWEVDDDDYGHWPLQDNPISARPRTGVPPVVSFIRDFCEALSPDYDVQIALTLRNQSDFLGSYYVEKRRHFPRFGQHDFVTRAQRVVRSEDPFLNWDQLVESISNIVGPGRLLLCFFEDGVQYIATQIAEFALETQIPDGSLAVTNRTAAGNGQWSVSDIPAEVWLRALLGRYGYSRWLPRLRKVLRQSIWPNSLRRPLFQFAKRALRLTPAASISIHVPQRLQQDIKKTYTNDWVSTFTGRDLSLLGY